VTGAFWTRVECRTPAEPPRGPAIWQVSEWNSQNLERPDLNPLEDWADSVFAYVYPEQAGIRRAISRSRWIYVGDQMDPYNWWNYHFYPASWKSVVFERHVVSKGRILGAR